MRASRWRTLMQAAWYLPLVNIGLPRLLLGRDPEQRRRWPGWVRRSGGVLLVAGAALDAWSIWVLTGSGAGTPAPFDPPRRLVQQGPYRFLRNPMELGGILAQVGYALLSSSARRVLYALGWSVLLHAYLRLVEEPELRRRFGSAYTRYCARVPRWGR